MLEWMTDSDDKREPETRTQPVASGVLYSLMAAFPSCAGAVVALYAVSLGRLGAFKIRLR
jgi:hypothetical protein